MSDRTAVRHNDKIIIHAVGGPANYDTLCGADSDDPAIGHYPADLPKKNIKIDCLDCIALIEACKKYKTSDYI